MRPRRALICPRSALTARRSGWRATSRSGAARHYGLGSSGRTGIAEGAPVRAVAPKQGVNVSGTNVQEEGVDEPDIVKTNGNTLFAVANGPLTAVDVRTASPRLVNTLQVSQNQSHELLLHGDRLLVLSRGGFWIEPAGHRRAHGAVRARAVHARRRDASNRDVSCAR